MGSSHIHSVLNSACVAGRYIFPSQSKHGAYKSLKEKFPLTNGRGSDLVSSQLIKL